MIFSYTNINFLSILYIQFYRLPTNILLVHLRKAENSYNPVRDTLCIKCIANFCSGISEMLRIIMYCRYHSECSGASCGADGNG